MITTKACIGRKPGDKPTWLELQGHLDFEVGRSIDTDSFIPYWVVKFKISPEVLQNVKAVKLTQELRDRMIADFTEFVYGNF